MTYDEAWKAADAAWRAAGSPIPCYDPAYMKAHQELQEVIKRLELIRPRIREVKQ